MAALDALEKQLDDIFVKKAPFQLPDNARKAIAQYLPWINLFFGLLSIWFAFSLWRWIGWVNDSFSAYNSVLGVYGVKTVEVGPLVYVSLIVMAIVGVLYIMAFLSTKNKNTKKGWNYMFYALLLTAIYGVVTLFTDYGGVSNFISSIIGTIIGLYLLFQIRSQYTGVTAHVDKTPPAAS